MALLLQQMNLKLKGFLWNLGFINKKGKLFDEIGILIFLEKAICFFIKI
jgi:hypothetical protein